MYLYISIGTALALFVLMLKIGLRKVLGYDVYVDIGCTLFLLYAFQGTATGMITATLAGLFLSIILYLFKLCIGYERYEEINEQESDWVYYPPFWKRW